MPDPLDSQNRPPAWYDPSNDPGYSGPPGRRWQRHRPPHTPAARLIGAIFLIGAGTLLFLDNIGVLPVRNIWDYWPVILIAVGVAKLSGRYPSERVTGTALVVFGALFLLLSLHVFTIHSWDGAWPFSLLLIAVGVFALIKAIESNASSRPRVGFRVHAPPPNPSSSLHENAVFGHVRRRFDNELFTGADLHSVFGNIELDLRGARTDLQKGPLVINLESVFGSIKLRVPQTWRVDSRVDGVFGSFEDKTIPAAAAQGFEPTILILTGSYVFGGIELDN